MWSHSNYALDRMLSEYLSPQISQEIWIDTIISTMNQMDYDAELLISTTADRLYEFTLTERRLIRGLFGAITLDRRE